MDRLKIALSKGALFQPVIDLLEAVGIVTGDLRKPGRRLRLIADSCEFIISRSADVPTFVEWGAVDIGFVGSDVIKEGDYDVFEILDLGIGECKFVLAGRPGQAVTAHPRVATKYPRTAGEYLTRRGLQAEIIKLYGSVELAPVVGLADQIIDLSSTGRTITDNGLAVIEEIEPVSCRLIANYVSYKLKSASINKLVDELRTTCERA